MIVYLVCYAASLLLALSRHYLLSGAGLLAAAVYLYASDYIRSGNLLHLRGIFALSFVGGQGLACMKLSYLSQAWSAGTWLGLLAAFAGFYLAFYYLEAFRRSVRPCGGLQARCAPGLESYAELFFSARWRWRWYRQAASRSRRSIWAIFRCCSVEFRMLFLFPCDRASLSDGVLCAGSGALCDLFLHRGRSQPGTAGVYASGRCSGGGDSASVRVALPAPVCGTAGIVSYMQVEHQLNPIYVVFALAGLIMLYILLTIARSHDTAYLNTVFEMKRHLPIFVTQPYIYIANNYDNFDCLVKGLVKHSWGMKMLAPFWTLTGLKFLVPSLTAFPYYVTKEELTTLTMFYDAYYDFGVIGVFVFSVLLGAAAYLLMRMMRQVQNPITYLLYAQFALYMLLSFFTTWFSNPSTWFYFAVTAVVAFLVSHKIAGR